MKVRTRAAMSSDDMEPHLFTIPAPNYSERMIRIFMRILSCSDRSEGDGETMEGRRLERKEQDTIGYEKEVTEVVGA